MSLDKHLLAEIGADLYGVEWRRAMARALGPLHPRGARETIDPRLPARWATGEREIPEWIGPALRRLLRARVERIEALDARIVEPPAPTPEPEPAALADEKPWYVRQRMPFDEMMRAHFGGVISPPSPLAQKRARLRRERSEAEIAARAAAQAAEAEDEEVEADEDEVEAPPPPAPELAPPAPEPDPYLAGLGLSMLQGLREPRGPEADAAVAALDARRPPGFPSPVRMLSLRTGEGEVHVILLLATGEEARVTVRWRAGDPAYEWRIMGQTPRVRHCWAADTKEWIPLRL